MIDCIVTYTLLAHSYVIRLHTSKAIWRTSYTWSVSCSMYCIARRANTSSINSQMIKISSDIAICASRKIAWCYPNIAGICTAISAEANSNSKDPWGSTLGAFRNIRAVRDNLLTVCYIGASSSDWPSKSTC